MASLVKQDFLDLIDRILPFEYVQPLKDPGPGYEIIEMYARLFERVSTAIDRFETASFIIFSAGGTKATGTVEFYRDTATAGAFTMKQGSIVKTSLTNREFVLIEDIAFGALDLTGSGTVQAAAKDHAYNVSGPITSADGTLLEGEIDTVSLPLQDPPLAERTIQVRQTTDITGGECAILDQLGEDRSISRRLGEDDGVYKVRIRSLPDTISPDAIRRQLDNIFLPLGLSYDFIETFEERYQAYWDAPNAAIPGSDFDPNLFVYDDPRANPPFRNRWLSEIDHRGSFIIVVPDVSPIEQFSYAYDDTAVTVADHVYTTGRRAHSAFDVPIGVDDDLILTPAYDGEDVGANQFYLILVDILNKIKAAGITVGIELEGE